MKNQSSLFVLMAATCAALTSSLPAVAACTAGPPLAGVAEQTPSNEFVVLANGTAVHLKTRLLWKRCAEGQTWSGASCTGTAHSFAWDSALAHSAATSDGGANNWRVPNRKELESITEFCGHSPAINQEVFPNTPSERFWSSTTFQADPGRAWDVYFSDGYVGAAYKSDGQFLRLVRNLTASDYPLPQTIVFGPVPVLAVGGSATVSAMATSGLPVLLSSASPDVCRLSGSTLTASSRGTCLLKANQPGDASFSPAPELGLSIEVGLNSQTISFGAMPVLTVGGYGTVSATASSGLPVSLATTTPSTCSLTGRTVKGLAAGSCSIVANQNGNGRFSPAPEATQNIPVSAASGTGGGTPPATVPAIVLGLLKGWNLVGNGSDAILNVESLFGDGGKIESIWKWVRNGSKAGIQYPTWAIRAPALTDKGAAWAARQGYELLTEIHPGEGFWVNAKSAFGVNLPGQPLPASVHAPLGTTQPGQRALGNGWSLVVSGDDLSPRQFYDAIGGQASGLITLWAWDTVQGRWFFYAPSLESRGGSALSDYAGKRGHLDFSATGRRLAPGTGFWVSRP